MVSYELFLIINSAQWWSQLASIIRNGIYFFYKPTEEIQSDAWAAGIDLAAISWVT
jgi:hypothetical protein